MIAISLEASVLLDTETTMIGEVTDIFGHRFVIRTDDKKALADLGPEGMSQISLKVGDQVEISGEMKPSELKVARIVRAGEEPVIIRGPKHHHREPEHHPHRGPHLHHGAEHDHGSEHDHGPGHHAETEADSARALENLKDRGLTAASSMMRKPKHFEVLGKDSNDALFEVHIDLDGTIRKLKHVKADEPKWVTERRR